MEKRPFPSYLPSGYLTSSSSFTSISLDIGPGFVIRHSDKEELTVGVKKVRCIRRQLGHTGAEYIWDAENR